MAALPVPNSVAAGIAANTFGVDLAQGSCVDDPNFATICSFLQNFGELIRVGSLPFDDLQQMLESTGDGTCIKIVYVLCKTFILMLFTIQYLF